MNNMDLYRSIGAIDEDLLERSERAVKTNRPWLDFAVAASLCIIICATVISSQLIREPKTPLNSADSDESKETEPPPLPPVPSDWMHILTIEGKDYSGQDAPSESLPKGYVFLREITKEEANGTDLGGCKLYVSPDHALTEGFWLYQPSDKLTASWDYQTPLPEWIYTHWYLAPQPEDREPEPETWPEANIIPDVNPGDVDETLKPTVNEKPAISDEKAVLSSLSKEEQLYFLKEKGIDVPEYAEDYIVRLIRLVEEDPTHPIVISNPVVFKLGENVKEVVNDYYGRKN